MCLCLLLDVGCSYLIFHLIEPVQKMQQKLWIRLYLHKIYNIFTPPDLLTNVLRISHLFSSRKIQNIISRMKYVTIVKLLRPRVDKPWLNLPQVTLSTFLLRVDKMKQMYPLELKELNFIKMHHSAGFNKPEFCDDEQLQHQVALNTNIPETHFKHKKEI